jgi:hypothetical protein
MTLAQALEEIERRDPTLLLRVGNRLLPAAGARDGLEAEPMRCDRLAARVTLTWFAAQTGRLDEAPSGVPVGIIRFEQLVIPREIAIYRDMPISGPLSRPKDGEATG